MNQSLQLKRYAGLWGLVVAALLCTLVATPDIAAQRRGGKVAEGWVELYGPHTDNETPYRLMKPMGFDSNKRYPAIVSLHGGGGRGTDNRKQLRNWNRLLAQKQRRSEYPSYVLAPQTTRLWDAAHLRKIKEVVAAGLKSIGQNYVQEALLVHSEVGDSAEWHFIGHLQKNKVKK